MYLFLPIIGIILLIIFVSFPLLILFLHSLYVVFKKAGRNGVTALIPFYNVIVLTQITKLKEYYFFIILAIVFLPIISFGTLTGLGGILSLFGFFSANYNLAKQFNKDEIFYGIGLTVLPVVFYPILAYSSAKFDDVIVSSFGPIPEETVNNVNKPSKFCRSCGNKVNTDKFCNKCGADQK